jgi:uncharacterized protein (TIGR04255 family)
MSDHRFEPIYRAHAIVEMAVFFEFAQGLGDMDHVLQIPSKMKDEFPESDKIQAFEVVFEQSQKPTDTKMRIEGVELKRLKSDESLEWLIRITSKSISIHCLEYTRWEDIWSQTNKYIGTIFKELQKFELSSIGLRYVDQFVFQGENEDYDLSYLFKKNTTLINPLAFSSGTNWHCNCGWFQDLKGLGNVLSHMNTTGITQDDHSSVVIDQTFMFQAQGEGENLAQCLLPDEKGEISRSNIIEKMHTANKYLLSDLLIDSMQQRISLCAEELS